MAEHDPAPEALPDNPDVQKEKCDPPPLEHLRAAQSAPIGAVLTTGESTLFDRKTGNPGPRVRPYGVTQTGVDPDVEEPDIGEAEAKPKGDDDDWENIAEEPKPEAPKKVDEPCVVMTTEEEAKVRDVVEELKIVFPNIKEEWLHRSTVQVLIKATDKDQWDGNRIVNWLMEYENLAPRKVPVVLKSSVLSKYDDYEMTRKMLMATKHEVNEDYQYFAEVKLTQKFPQFSMYSLRQVLRDCDYMYPLAVLNIMEGLERSTREDKRTWKDWHKHELIFIVMQKPSDGKYYKYPLCVVKGEKFWCKKKAKMTGFPPLLSREIRLVERALFAYERRFIKLKEKLDAEVEKKERLLAAIAGGYALECPICMEDFIPEEQISCTAGHIMCVRCLQSNIREACTGNLQLTPQGELPCFCGSCEGIFPLIMLCHMLPPESMAMYEERLWHDFITKSGIPNLQKCPQCGYVEQIEAETDIVKLFECKNPRCGLQSCRSCRNPWKEHVGKSCSQMAADPESELRKKYDDMLSEVVMRRCIRCRRPQFKFEGCNKLTCQCGAKMCYLCRKPIDVEQYQHFCRHATDPGRPCPCGGCQLFGESEKIDNELRERLLVQFQEDLMDLKMQKEKAAGKLALSTKMSSTTPTPQTSDAPVEEPPPAAQGPMAPQQRQFAAIFG